MCLRIKLVVPKCGAHRIQVTGVRRRHVVDRHVRGRMDQPRVEWIVDNSMDVTVGAQGPGSGRVVLPAAQQHVPVRPRRVGRPWRGPRRLVLIPSRPFPNDDHAHDASAAPAQRSEVRKANMSSYSGHGRGILRRHASRSRGQPWASSHLASSMKFLATAMR